MRLLTGFGTPRRWADAKIGVIWLPSPVNDQTEVMFACLVVIDGPFHGKVLAIKLILFNRSKPDSERC